MKKFLILEEKIKLLIQMHEKLGFIEVKGDSVEHLFSCRLILKQVVESIAEIKEDEKKVQTEDEIIEELKEGEYKKED